MSRKKFRIINAIGTLFMAMAFACLIIDDLVNKNHFIFLVVSIILTLIALSFFIISIRFRNNLID